MGEPVRQHRNGRDMDVTRGKDVAYLRPRHWLRGLGLISERTTALDGCIAEGNGKYQRIFAGKRHVPNAAAMNERSAEKS